MKLSGDMLTHGVNIVCATYAGERAGLAVAWATQVGNDQVLICVGKQSKTRDLILASEAFGLSVLAADQVDISARFGQHHSDAIDKFEGLQTFGAETGSPLLADCILALDCRVIAVHDQGREKLIIGQVKSVHPGRSDDQRLTYSASDY